MRVITYDIVVIWRALIQAFNFQVQDELEHQLRFVCNCLKNDRLAENLLPVTIFWNFVGGYVGSLFGIGRSRIEKRQVHKHSPHSATTIIMDID